MALVTKEICMKMKKTSCIFALFGLAMSAAFAGSAPTKLPDQKLPDLVCAKQSPYKYYVSYTYVVEGGQQFAFNYSYVCLDQLADSQKGIDEIIQKLKSDERGRRGQDGSLTIMSILPLKR